MEQIKRIYGVDLDLEQIQQATQEEITSLYEMSRQWFGVPIGPKFTDCEAHLGYHLILEPAENMVVTLQPIAKADIGRGVTITYNNDESYTVTIYSASNNQTIDGLTSKSLAARESISLIALPGQTWGVV